MLFPPRILASVLLALACSACAGAAGGARSGQGSGLRVVTFTPRPGQAIPSSLVETSSLRLGVTVRHGFACFTMDGIPVAWPAGFAAIAPRSGGHPEVRTTAGSSLLTGGAYKLDVMTIQSTGDACSNRGQNVTAVLDVRAG